MTDADYVRLEAEFDALLKLITKVRGDVKSGRDRLQGCVGALEAAIGQLETMINSGQVARARRDQVSKVVDKLRQAYFATSTKLAECNEPETEKHVVVHEVPAEAVRPRSSNSVPRSRSTWLPRPWRMIFGASRSLAG